MGCLIVEFTFELAVFVHVAVVVGWGNEETVGFQEQAQRRTAWGIKGVVRNDGHRSLPLPGIKLIEGWPPAGLEE
jgi:hypothetical protein